MTQARIARQVVVALTLAFLGAHAALAQDPYSQAREEFRRAYDAAASGDPPAQDSAALVAYPLYPYLERARIAAQLRAANERAARADDLARAFLERHAAEPYAAELRGVWLRSLADREEWRAYVEHYRPTQDAALRCEHMNARIALDAGADLERDIAALWLTPEQLPPECVAPFDWLRAREALDSGLVEQRVRLLLENGQAAFARTVARELPAERAAPLLLWASLLERPKQTIDELLAARAPYEPEALLAGWAKLARNDPSAALERYADVRRLRGLDRAHGSRIALALALGLAWDRRAETGAAFADVQSEHLDDYALEWRARAALWAGDWRAAADAIAGLSDEQRSQTRWRYWAARTAAALGDEATARELYEAVLPSDNYYAAVAAARLGRRTTPHPQKLPADGERLRALASRPPLVRARELLLAGLSVAAASEWSAAYAAAAADERAQLVHLAASWGWHDVSVQTATRENVFFDYAVLYPQPYIAEVHAAATRAGLAPPLIYGVIRQESLYRVNAVSAAGAIGLAQLTPDTARVVARRWQEPTPKIADLMDPAVNVRLGAAHLRTLTDRYGGQLPVALAAYNAGPNAAERWLPPATLDSDVWIENIPYNETREYVQRVLWHSVVFAWLATGAAQDTSSWLAPTQRLAAAAAEAY